MIEVLSCPFCESDDVKVIHDLREHLRDTANGSTEFISVTTYRVRCSDCSAEGPWDQTQDCAIINWNTAFKDIQNLRIELNKTQAAVRFLRQSSSKVEMNRLWEALRDIKKNISAHSGDDTAQHMFLDNLDQETLKILFVADVVDLVPSYDPNRKSHCSCGETPCVCPF